MSNPSEVADDQYTVVARRYRPQAFGQLVGQQHITQALSNAIRSSRVGHAYLFTGARGVGKTSSARIFAKCLNCANGPVEEPCNECDICKSVSVGEDVDVLEIDGASNRGIDEIRQLRSNAAVRPSRCRFKIYIIDEVHMLTQQAFNALLKTLEEPPKHVKFIFCTTDPQKIPITVLSRCQRFDFSPVQTKQITTRLQEIAEAENVKADSGALELLARRAGGSMRDSQSLLEQLFSFCGDSISIDEVHQLLGTADISRIAEVAGSMADNDSAQALNLIATAMSDGVDAGQLADQLLGYFRDMMANRVGCHVETLLHCGPDDVASLKEIAEKLGLETILAAVQIMDNAVTRMQNSLHIRTLLEVAVVRICNLENLNLISDLVASLQGGKSKLGPRSKGTAKKQSAPKKNEVAEKNPSSQQGSTSSSGTSGSSGADASGASALASESSDVVHASVTAEENLNADQGSVAAQAGVGVAAGGAMSAGAAMAAGAAMSAGDAAMNSGAGPSGTAVADPTEIKAAAVPAIESKTGPEPVAENESGSQTASVPQSAPTDSGVAVANEPAAGTDPTTIGNQSAQSVWEKVLLEMNDLTADYASEFEKVELRGQNELVVTLKNSYHRDMCSRPQTKEKIESTLHRVAGKQLRVDFLVSKIQAQKESQPRMTRNQQLLALKERPFIKEMIETFDAEIHNFYVPSAKRR